jgi:hypothetical protein
MIALSKSIRTISFQFDGLIEGDFLPGTYSDDVIVDDTDLEKNTIVAKYDSHRIECLTNLDISKIRIGTKIKIRYKLIRVPDNLLQIQPFILFYCSSKDPNGTFKMAIKCSKIQTKLDQVVKRNKHFPFPVKNIGLVVIETHTTILDKFKMEFQSKCTGTLFIYKLSIDRIKRDFASALNYFSKYHQIDLICILTQKLDPNHLLSLSSTYVLSHFKPIPYTVAISSNGFDWSVSNLADKQLKSVDPLLNFIHQNQMKYSKYITNALNQGKQELENISRVYQRKICSCEFDILDLNPKQLVILDPIDELKKLVLKALDRELNKLIGMELSMAKSICEMAEKSANNLKEDILL